MSNKILIDPENSDHLRYKKSQIYVQKNARGPLQMFPSISIIPFRQCRFLKKPMLMYTTILFIIFGSFNTLMGAIAQRKQGGGISATVQQQQQQQGKMWKEIGRACSDISYDLFNQNADQIGCFSLIAHIQNRIDSMYVCTALCLWDHP